MRCLLAVALHALVQPVVDHRVYEERTLPNGLRVLYVQDTASPKSGISLAVDFGSLHEPADWPGLAHLIEHAVFLGSSRFPDEGAFDAFLAAHGGDSNAFTAEERTVFYAYLNADALADGVDRFADIIAAPLLDPERIEREVSAVAAEHAKNIPVPARRAVQLLRDMLTPTSNAHFFTGDRETLGRPGVGARLRAEWEAQYCAPRMHLVVLGPDVKALQARVEESFSRVRPSCAAKPVVDPLAFKAPGSLVVTPTSGQPQLAIGFALPALTADRYRSNAWGVVEFVLTSEAPGSWLAEARREGLASDVACDSSPTAAGTLGFAFVTLTEAGASKPQEVYRSIEQYLKQVPSKPLVASVQAMYGVNFNYTNPDDTVLDTVERLATGSSAYQTDDVLAGGQVLLELDMPLIQAVFANLTAAHSCAVLLTPSFNGSGPTEVEHWYNATYHLDQGVLVTPPGAFHVSVDAKLPPAIKYTPTRLAVKNVTAGLVPEVVASGAYWQGHGKAASRQPLAYVYVKLSRAPTRNAAEEAALGRWAAEAVTEAAADAADPFTSAGLDLQVEYKGDALQFRFLGFDEYMPEFMSAVLGAVHAAATGPDEALAKAKDRSAALLADVDAEAAYEAALAFYSAVANSGRASRAQTISALARLSAADLRAWLGEPVAPVQFYYGNMDRAVAKRTAESVRALFNVTHAPVGRTKVRAPKGHDAVWRTKTPSGSDTVTLAVFQKQVTPAERANLVVLGQFLQPRLYNALRTEQSLGYIVDAFVVPHLDVVELKVIVQGQTEPGVVADRIDKELRANVDAVAAAAVASYVAAVKQGLTKDATMEQEARRLWAEVHSGQGCWTRRAEELAALPSVTQRSLAKSLSSLLEHRVLIELDPSANETNPPVLDYIFPEEKCSRPLLRR
jgi:insulysin